MQRILIALLVALAPVAAGAQTSVCGLPQGTPLYLAVDSKVGGWYGCPDGDSDSCWALRDAAQGRYFGVDRLGGRHACTVEVPRRGYPSLTVMVYVVDPSSAAFRQYLANPAAIGVHVRAYEILTESFMGITARPQDLR